MSSNDSSAGVNKKVLSSGDCSSTAGLTCVNLTGVVTDYSGAAIRNAQVEAESNNYKETSATRETGSYLLVLPPGTYTLKVTANGFAEATQTVILDAHSEPAVANAVLQIGRLSSTVSVTAAPDYVANSSSTATKTDTPLIDTPQSITVITEPQMEARTVQTVADTMRYTAGVDAEPYGTDTRIDWFFIRGFGMTTDGLFLDGLALPKIYGVDASYTANPYSLQSVDVIKGPASVLYGQNEPGGLVDLKSKRPPSQATNQLQFEAGTFSRFQGMADFGGPLTDSGHWLYRVTGLLRESGTQVRYADDNQGFIAPALTWKPDTQTSFTLLTDFLQVRTGSVGQFLPSQGTLLPNPNGMIPTNFQDSDPSYDEFKKTEYSAGFQFSRQLDERWTVRENFRFIHLGVPKYVGLFGNGFEAPPGESDFCTANPTSAQCLQILSRASIESSINAAQYASDTQLQGIFRKGKLTQTVLAGYNYQYQGSHIQNGYGYPTNDAPYEPPPINVYSPVYFQPITPPGFISVNTDGTFQQHGVYLQDQVSYNRWSLILSGREDWAIEHARNLLETEQPPSCPSAASLACVDQNASKFSGRVGLLYHFDFGLSPYFSYATSFNPVPGVNVYGVAYVPDTGQQYEAGAKYQPRSINAFMTVSLFQVNQQNVLTTDPNNPLNSIQAGAQRTRGAEFEGTASLSHSLNLVGSYTHQNAIYTAGNYGFPGKSPVTVPANMGSLWFDYNPHSHFGAGIGVRVTGQTPASLDNSLYVYEHTLLDAEVHYSFHNWRLGVNVQNLFDKTYVAYCYGASDCNYGYQRTVIGSVTYRFPEFAHFLRQQ